MTNSLTPRPIVPKSTSQQVSSEGRTRWAFVVCPCVTEKGFWVSFDSGATGAECELCQGKGQLKLELIRLAPGSKAKGDRISIKRDVYDDAASKRIRERDNWACTACGKEPHKQGLHAMHFIGRSHDTLFEGFDQHSKAGGCCLKHTDANLAAGCWGCHTYLDRHAAEREAHFRQLRGDQVIDDLLALKAITKKRVKRKAEA